MYSPVQINSHIKLKFYICKVYTFVEFWHGQIWHPGNLYRFQYLHQVWFANRPKVAECIFEKQANTFDHCQEFTRRRNSTSFSKCVGKRTVGIGRFRAGGLHPTLSYDYKNISSHYFDVCKMINKHYLIDLATDKVYNSMIQ